MSQIVFELFYPSRLSFHRGHMIDISIEKDVLVIFVFFEVGESPIFVNDDLLIQGSLWVEVLANQHTRVVLLLEHILNHHAHDGSFAVVLSELFEGESVEMRALQLDTGSVLLEESSEGLSVGGVAFRNSKESFLEFLSREH